MISSLSPAQVQAMEEESYTVKTLTAGERTTEGEKQNLHMGSASTLNQLTDAKSRFKDYSNAKSAIKMETGKEMVQNTSGHQTEEKVKVKIALDRLHESGEVK